MAPPASDPRKVRDSRIHTKGTFVCHISELSRRFGSAAKTIHLNGRVIEFKQVPSKKTGKKQGVVVGEY